MKRKIKVLLINPEEAQMEWDKSKEENNGEAETRKSLAEGHGITFPNAEEAIKWLIKGEQAKFKEDIVSTNESLNKWCNTQEINYYEGTEALGFLFKYAVPKLWLELNRIGKFYVLRRIWRTIEKALLDGEDVALAVFWEIKAIWEVISGGK